MTSSSKPPERYFSAICTNGVFRIRMRATFGPQNASFNRTGNRASANFHRSAVLSSRVSGWRATIEHTQPIALVARAISQGTRLIQNLRGGLKALRSLSFRSRVQFCQEPTRVLNVLFRPKPLSLLTAHEINHEAGAIGNAQKSFGEIQNAVR